ncbi:hypothetical protein K8I28_10550 [bacterium]|nr:hypothetical protein [bacterium]
MARPVRIHIPHSTYLIQVRAKDGESLFTSEIDREVFLYSMGESALAAGVEVYAYALMPASVLLYVRNSDIPLSKFVHRSLSGYFNRIRRVTGKSKAVLRDRHREILVEEETCFFDVLQRVHLAPIIGDKWSGVSEGRKWGEVSRNRWTSFSVYTGQLEPPPGFALEEILARFGEKSPNEKFYTFIMDGVKQFESDIFDRIVSMSLLGSEEFVAHYRPNAKGRWKVQPHRAVAESNMPNPAKIFTTILDVTSNHYECEPHSLLMARKRHPGRKIVVELALRHALDASGIKGLADKLNVSGSALAHMRNSFYEDLERSPELQQTLDTLEQALFACFADNNQTNPSEAAEIS